MTRKLLLKPTNLWLAGILIGGAIGVRWVMQKPAGCAVTELTTPSHQVLHVEVANTPASRAQGLSGRPSLEHDQGMLFLFPTTGTYSFWMKDTLIPLDIIWLQDQQVVEVATLQPPTTSTIPTHTPTHDANAVIEVNAGQAQTLGLAPGAQVHWATCSE